jgi:hypothetical protein
MTMDIYLTDGTICPRCHVVGWANPKQVLLQDAWQRQYVVAPDQIKGVQKHPILARLFVHSIQNHGPDGLPGRIIVPQAWDDERHWLKYSQQP